MNTYPSSQVLTVSELNPEDALHCGKTGGRCMPWIVISKTDDFALVKVGDTIVKMTGKDIRQGQPMYRAAECPVCSISQQAMNTAVREESRLFPATLECANIQSALAEVDNHRKGGGKSGGARLRTPKDLFDTRVNQLVEKIMKAPEKV